MKLRILKSLTVVVAASLVSLSAVAIPIGGQMEFAATGTFITAGGTPNGFDFSDGGTGPSGNFDAPLTFTSGDISTILGIAPGPLLPVGTGPLIHVFDFDLAALPTLEWIIPTLSGGFSQFLTFTITSGTAVDLGGGGGFDDLAGVGILAMVCDPSAPDASSCAAADTVYDATEAGWSLSNSGAFSVVGQVPEPVTLGLLGLGLLGLGAVRRRRVNAA